MAGRSKRYREALETIDRDKLYSFKEAVEVLTGLPKGSFDESVDLAINLGVDPKHADQMVRGAILMPNGTGREVRILVFAKGDKEHEAREAGADRQRPPGSDLRPGLRLPHHGGAAGSLPQPRGLRDRSR